MRVPPFPILSVTSRCNLRCTGCFAVAGGEAFLLPDLANLFRDHADRLFPAFTNGTALRSGDYDTLRHCPNTAIVASLEGDRDLTDLRRGCGVFGSVIESLHKLRRAGSGAKTSTTGPSRTTSAR